MQTTTSISGDTWDTIARRVYGNERLAQLLMEARENIRLLDYQIFPGGVKVAVPDKPAQEDIDDLPDWRK